MTMSYLLSIILWTATEDVAAFSMPEIKLPWYNQPEYIFQILDMINRRRALHDSPPLVWNSEAALDALRQAKAVVMCADPDDDYITLLNMSPLFDPVHTIHTVYDIPSVKFKYGGTGSESDAKFNNFAFVVWAGFKYVGCATFDHEKAKSKGRQAAVTAVCNFGPARIFFYGMKPAMVPPPKSSWPAGWKPPSRRDTDVFSKSMYFKEPWPGYKWKQAMVPPYSGDTSGYGLIKREDEFGGPPVFDERRLPKRYRKFVAAHGPFKTPDYAKPSTMDYPIPGADSYTGIPPKERDDYDTSDLFVVDGKVSWDYGQQQERNKNGDKKSDAWDSQPVSSDSDVDTAPVKKKTDKAKLWTPEDESPLRPGKDDWMKNFAPDDFGDVMPSIEAEAPMEKKKKKPKMSRSKSRIEEDEDADLAAALAASLEFS